MVSSRAPARASTLLSCSLDMNLSFLVFWTMHRPKLFRQVSGYRAVRVRRGVMRRRGCQTAFERNNPRGNSDRLRPVRGKDPGDFQLGKHGGDSLLGSNVEVAGSL